MKRNRLRTDIENLLLQSLFSIAAGESDARILSVTTFARAAGLSRQALYKSHADVVTVLSYLSRPRGTDSEGAVLRERIQKLWQEKEDSDKKLQGAVIQNGELIVQVNELRQQLKARGLSIVR